MEDILDICKYILPSVVVFVTAFYLLKTFLQADHKKRLVEIRMGNNKVITPLRLQAYERVVLLLERISPESIISRSNISGSTASQLQLQLISAIRTEFEHNLSQQVYMSDSAWEMVKNAKEETIKMINLSMSKLSDSAQGMDLCKILLEMTTKMEKLPTVNALEYVKREVRQNF
ncbi:MAG: hypothetical protein V2A54_15040 [Bacteroidota bacterium]